MEAIGGYFSLELPLYEVHHRDTQDCVGELILKYGNMEQMNEVIENMDKYVHIKVEMMGPFLTA